MAVTVPTVATAPMGRLVRFAHWAGAVAVAAFLVSVIVRPVDSDITWLDGWAVDLFEIAAGLLCISRYAVQSWRSLRWAEGSSR